MWLKKFAPTFEAILPKSTVQNLFDVCIAEDNQASILDAIIPTLSKLSNYIDLKYLFLVDNDHERNAELRYVKSKDMVADFLTKFDSTQKFQHLMRQTGMK